MGNTGIKSPVPFGEMGGNHKTLRGRLGPIPEHIGCLNCGECCGAVAATSEELLEIHRFLAMHPEARQLAIGQSGNFLFCPFRDRRNKRCSIYKARPLLCRLMGVAALLECKFGNTCNIDGYQFMKERASQPVNHPTAKAGGLWCKLQALVD